MKEENIILNKSYDFGIRILKLYLHLRKNKVDIGLCSQILNSGTSIGANVEEAVGGASRKDFINKLQTAYKESRETRYWLRLLKDGKMIVNNSANVVATIPASNGIVYVIDAVLLPPADKK